MSTPGVFIAGTDTGIGKTRITCGLLDALRAQGRAACGMKPVATGIAQDWHHSQDLDEDVSLIASKSYLRHGHVRTAAIERLADLNPYRFEPPVSPHLAAAQAGTQIEPSVVAAAAQRLAEHCDVLLVEGTGGWLAPISERATMADIAHALRLPVVLVVGMRLGCLNHALLTVQAIATSGLTLAGWIANHVDPAMLMPEDNVATLTSRIGAPLLARLPYGAEPEPLLQAAALTLFP